MRAPSSELVPLGVLKEYPTIIGIGVPSKDEAHCRQKCIAMLLSCMRQQFPKVLAEDIYKACSYTSDELEVLPDETLVNIENYKELFHAALDKHALDKDVIASIHDLHEIKLFGARNMLNTPPKITPEQEMHKVIMRP